MLETILYGCVTWSRKPAGYDGLRPQVYTRCSSDASAGGNGSPKTTLSYALALVKTDSESIETTVRRRRILFVVVVTRTTEEVMFGELVGGKG